MRLLNNKIDQEFFPEILNLNVNFNAPILDIAFDLVINTETIIQKTCNIDITNYKGGFVDIVSLSLEDPNTIFVIPSYKAYSYANKLRKQIYNNEDKRLFTIMVNDDGTDCDILICPLITEANLPIYRPDSFSTYSKIFTTLSTIGKVNFDKFKNKSALLGNLSNEDSIAYLEAQVDILTRIIINKFKDNPEFQQYMDILQAADQYSILNIKSQENLLKEIENKKNVRTEQVTYYAKKASN